MNKQQVINKLYKHLSQQEMSYQKWEIVEVVEPFLALISEELNNGNNINLSQFGKFSVRTRKSRAYYNINTRQMESSTARREIVFTPDKNFNKMVARE